MVKIKKEHSFLIAILIFGFILRIWGINFGLPYQFHQDEPVVVNHALGYGTGDFNPHFFAIPPLVSYILFFIYSFYFFIGKIFGIFANTNDFALSFFKDPTSFYILGRLFIGVIPGVLGILFTYKLYKIIFPLERGALFASSVVAFGFLNITDSHYIYTDMLMLLFIILTMIRIFMAYNQPSFKNYILCAILTGVTASIKYNAIIMCAPLFALHLLMVYERRENFFSFKIICTGLCVLFAFFATNPFALLDFKFFLNSLSSQSQASGYIGFTHHIKYSLSQNLGYNIIVLALLGFLTIFIKHRKKFLLFGLFPVIFYVHLIFLSQPFARYCLPLVPFFAIGSAWFIFGFLFPKIAFKPAKIIILTASFLIFIPLIAKGLYADILFVSQDTRIESAAWIKLHLKPDTFIAVDHTFFRPAINQNIAQLKEKYKLINAQQGLKGLKEKKFNLMLKAHPGEGYNIYFLSTALQSQGQFFSTMPALSFDIAEIRKNNIEYVIINYANRQKDSENFYPELKNNAVLVKYFSPYEDNVVRFSRDITATTALPVLSEELYSRKQSGPALGIYKLEK